MPRRKWAQLFRIPADELTAELLRMRDDNGDTPLHLAAQGGHLSQIPPALLNDETLTLTNHVGISVRRMAVNHGFASQLPRAISAEIYQVSRKFLRAARIDLVAPTADCVATSSCFR